MKKLWALLLCMLLFALPAASLVLQSESTVEEPVRLAVKRALERSLLPRMQSGETLRAHLFGLYSLHLQVGERELAFDLSPSVEDLEEHLVSSLEYDGLSLLESIPVVGLEFAVERGFATTDRLIGEGRSYWVLDGQGNKRGVVVASHVRKSESSLAFLQQSSGKELFTGMGLAPMGPLSLSLGFSLDESGALGVDVTTSYPLASYPFSVLLGLVTPDFQQGYLVGGLISIVPLTHLFSSKTHLVRNLGLEGRVLVGLGTSFGGGGLLYYSEGSLALVYRRGEWTFSLGGGNRVTASSPALVHRGLFLSLGTSYTYTP